MPYFAIETTYRMPVYRQQVYWGSTLDQACRRAIEDDDWSDQKFDTDSPGQTHVTGAWSGVEAHCGQAHPIPSQYGETIERKAAHFDALVEVLRYPAQALGLSATDFADWLPRAQAAIAKAEAIAAGARDPD